MSIVDVDGNVYTSVVIGTQEWTVENLKTTKLNDGTAITEITDGGTWAARTSSARCWYNNNSANITPYGSFYNWYAVNTGKLAISGWRIPSKDDYDVLIAFLGGGSVAGGKLKEAGTTNWSSPNTGADNSSGFTALGSGFRNWDGSFLSFSTQGPMWSTTAVNGSVSYRLLVEYNFATAGSSGNSSYATGFPVRCVREAVVVAFSGSPTSGDTPLAITFTDESTGATSWSWDFGDGSTSTLQNPTHTYAVSGTYTVALTINGTDTETKTGYITANLTTAFSASPLTGKKPLNVTFTNLSA